ncbi:MAG: hypothetical protein ACYDDT_14700 [Sulfuricella sp.]
MFSGEKLVFVPGIGADCDYQANQNEPGMIVKFEAAILGGAA